MQSIIVCACALNNLTTCNWTWPSIYPFKWGVNFCIFGWNGGSISCTYQGWIFSGGLWCCMFWKNQKMSDFIIWSRGAGSQLEHGAVNHCVKMKQFWNWWKKLYMIAGTKYYLRIKSMQKRGEFCGKRTLVEAPSTISNHTEWYLINLYWLLYAMKIQYPA